MITWGESDWSLSDLLAALEYEHRQSARHQRRDVLAAGEVVACGTYGEVVAWLRDGGQL